LGTINNANQTITLLGHTAQPTFVGTDDNDDTETVSAKNLTVSYSQKEWSLMPKISIGNNPYRSKNANNPDKLIVLWELSLGYNFPFSDKNGINLSQDDGNGNSNSINGRLISLKTPGVSFMYNNKQTTFSPFRFSGLYIALSFRICSSWYH
jgi:hypothetical protein